MTLYYSVADLPFSVSANPSFGLLSILSNYKNFQIEYAHSLIFKLHIEVSSDRVEQLTRTLSCIHSSSPYIWHASLSCGSVFSFSNKKDRPQSALLFNAGSNQATLYLSSQISRSELSLGINNSLMLLFAFFSSFHSSLLVHASVVACRGRAHAFIARSGTGKSTHSDLWLQHIPHCKILNDDNPVVRIVNGEALVYGSPWSGKRNFYLNERYPLHSVVRLSQHHSNFIIPLTGMDAFVSLLPSCSCISWDEAMSAHVIETVDRVTQLSRSYHLQCLPDSDAVFLCHHIVCT